MVAFKTIRWYIIAHDVNIAGDFCRTNLAGNLHKVIDCATNWGMPLNWSKRRLVTRVSDGLAVTKHHGRATFISAKATRDLGVKMAAGCKWPKIYQGTSNKAREVIFRLTLARLYRKPVFSPLLKQHCGLARRMVCTSGPLYIEGDFFEQVYRLAN